MSDKAGAPPLACKPSPNCSDRRAGPTDILLLHYTGMPDADQSLEWLCDPQSGVSSHYFVYEDGRIVQMVDERRRAWHAGESCWAGETDINSRSIGVEIANPGHAAMTETRTLPPFPDRQIEAVIGLCRDILSRNTIPKHRVLAHSDVAPARKTDPGEAFPWARLAAQGIGAWVEPQPLRGGRFLTLGDAGQPVEALQTMLAIYGYAIEPTGEYDQTTCEVVTAFQRHFRQERVDGIADESTTNTLHKLIKVLL